MYGSLGLVRDRREMQRRQQYQRSLDSQISKNSVSSSSTTESPQTNQQKPSAPSSNLWSLAFLTESLQPTKVRPPSQKSSDSSPPQPALE